MDLKRATTNPHLFEYKDQIALGQPHNRFVTNFRKIGASPVEPGSLKVQFFVPAD
jgi:hypothetical protein